MSQPNTAHIWQRPGGHTSSVRWQTPTQSSSLSCIHCIFEFQSNNVFSPGYRYHGVEIVGYVFESTLRPFLLTDRSIDLYEVDLPPVSLIPGFKATRQKDYDKYYANIALSSGENQDFIFIAKDLHLATSAERHWLNSIPS